MVAIVIPHKARRRALILVDIQDGFLNDDNRWIIPHVKSVIRDGGYAITVAVAFHADRGSLWDKQIGWTFPMRSTSFDIARMLDRSAINLLKTTKSAFKGDKDLHSILQANMIEEVHIAGFDTEDCVFATAQESFDLGFATYVIEECTASSEANKYRRAALVLLRHLGMTNHSDMSGSS